MTRAAQLLACLALFASCSEAPSPTAGSNVLLIVVDALAASHLGAYGYPKATSPFMDSLARRGVLFENAISTASQTVPATLSLFSSAYPSRHGNQYFSDSRSFRRPDTGVRPQVPADLSLMAEHFQTLGYRTGAVTANPWLRPRYGFARGFDEFVFLPTEVADPRARFVNSKALQFIDERPPDTPFFLYLHYMDVHNPYRPPPRYRDQFTKGLRGRNLRANGPMPDASAQDVAVTRALYDAEIRALDELLRDLTNRLEELGELESTWIVFTADHGEEFHEHGGMGHGWTLFEEMLHVPLIFFHPKLASDATRISEPVSIVDLLPTLLELVGAKPAPDLDGVSLAPVILGRGEAAAERVVFSELGAIKSARQGQHKLVSSRQAASLHARGTSAFDLGSDPGERHRLQGVPAWQAALEPELERLHELTKLSSQRATDESRANQSDAPDEPWFEEQLRALGYVE